MKKFRRVLIAGLLMLALAVPVATPVAASTGLDDALWAAIFDLQDQIRALQDRPEATPPPPQAPMIRLVNPSSITVMPGEELEVTLSIRNIGMGTAHSLLTQASPGDGPFRLEFVGTTNNINSIPQNGQRNMTLRVIVDENAAPGSYAITLTHHFRNNVGENSTNTDTISVRVGGEAGVSNVRLRNISASVSTIGADQTFTVTAELQNAGSIAANNVQVSVGNLSPTTIFLTSDAGQNFFSSLDADQTRQVSFTFQTARNIPSNVYQLDFRVTYDGAGERPATPFFVTVLSDYATESANIEMRGLTAPTGRLNVSQSGRISFELVNTGDAIANSVLVSATALEPGALVPTTTNRQSIQNFGVGETRAIEFGFMPTANAETRSYAVQLKVEYTMRGATEPSSFVQYIALNAHNPDEGPTPTPGAVQIPRVIVSAFNVTPQIPRAGQNFDMDLTFLNTSPTRSVNNIRVELNSVVTEQGTGAVFTPAGGSNTLFIHHLHPGEAITLTVPMFTVPDAAPRIYTLDVVLEYQDQDYAEHRSTDRLSIPVAQFARLETDPPEISIMPFMDMFGFVDFEIGVINSGRVDLRNVRVRTEGNFDTSQASGYMGPLVQQRTNTFRGRIFPLEPGFHEGTITIYGEDDAGEIIEIVHAFAIEVMDAGGFGGDMGFPGEGGMFEGGAFERPGFGDWDDFPGEGGEGDGIIPRILAFVRRPIFWGPAAGVVVLAGAIAAIVIYKRKSNRLFDDDDAFN